MSRISFISRVLEGKVLDVGHSVGPLHSEIGRGRDVTAIDIVIKRPEKKVAKADATRMPFREKAFDSVLAGELIEHIEEPTLFVKEGRRVLKRGGLLVITTPNRKSLLNRLFKAYEKPAHVVLFSKDELLRLLEDEGFAIESYCLFPYTEESSEGSRYRWFYGVRRIMHVFLPDSLREEMVVVARVV